MTDAELEAALAAAGRALDAAEDGALPLAARERVWAALGPGGGEARRPGPGWRRRAVLARHACERALPLYERERPGDRGPRDALALARAIGTGEADEATARAEAGRLWARTETLTQVAGDPARLAVGFACAKAILVALHDEYFEPEPSGSVTHERELELDQIDPAFLAAMAIAGGLPWAHGTDAEARRSFWRWWLEEAVPRAAAE